MADPIKPGDNVMLVRGTRCCNSWGAYKWGHCFRVLQIGDACMQPCRCGRIRIDDVAVERVIGPNFSGEIVFQGFELYRLIKLPGIQEQQSVLRVEGLPLPEGIDA